VNMLTDILNLVTETMAKPSLLGAVGKRIERKAKDDLASYFRLLRKDILELDIAPLMTQDSAIARDHVAMFVQRVTRNLTPSLLSILKINIYEAMMLSDKQAVIIIKEDATGLDRLGLTGQQAADYAAKHAGEAVTGINNTTRDRIADAIAEGITEQLGVDGTGRLLRNLMDDMTVTRANMIATTEMNDAMSEAQMQKMNRIGVKYKRVILAPDPCDICIENEDAGAIPIDELFPSGDMRTPFHPNCRCAVVGARPEENLDVALGDN
jgi:hypothetical protein